MGFLQSALLDGYRDSPSNLSHIEVIDRPPGGWLVLPALFAVHALEQHPVVLVGSHGQSGIPNTAVGGTPIGVRPHRSRTHSDHQHFAVRRDLNPFYRRKRRWVNPLEFAAQLFDGVLADVLVVCVQCVLGRNPCLAADLLDMADYAVIWRSDMTDARCPMRGRCLIYPPTDVRTSFRS